jgi:hypothetical protein
MRSQLTLGSTCWAALLVAAGCAPSLATLQPAHVAPARHAQVTMGMEIGIPTGTVVRAVDAGSTVIDKVNRGEMLTDGDKVQLYDAGVNLAISPVGVGHHFAIAYTVVDRVEVGLRYASGGFRLGGRYQVLRKENKPFDMVVGLGISRAATPIPFGDTLPVLKISDFVRYAVDVPLLIGTSRQWFRAWIGPRIVLTRFDTKMTLELTGEPVELAALEGNAFYFGGQAGLALGFRYVFVGFELTLAQLVGSATLSAAMLNPPVRSTDISGFVIYPSFGLMGEF